MTEHQMTELLERATADLQPDPDLVAGRLAVGRRRRRRHLVGTAAATVAVLGVVGTGLTVALSGDDADGARRVDVRVVRAAPDADARPSRPPSTRGRWR